MQVRQVPKSHELPLMFQENDGDFWTPNNSVTYDFLYHMR